MKPSIPLLTTGEAAAFVGMSAVEFKRARRRVGGPAYYSTPGRRYCPNELKRWQERIQSKPEEAGPVPRLLLSLPLRRLVDDMLAASVDRPGWIYFLQAEGGGSIKIGFGRNLPQRIADIRGISPVWLDFLGAIPGSMGGEFKLHQFFREFNTHSEWFTPHESLLQFIEEITPRFWTRIVAQYPASAARQRPVVSSVSPRAWHAAIARRESA